MRTPTEFEWFAGVAAELATTTMNLKKGYFEEASFFYKSDVRWCIARITINEKKTYFLLDYPQQSFQEAGDDLENSLKDLDSFIIQTEGNATIIYKSNDEITSRFSELMD